MFSREFTTSYICCSVTQPQQSGIFATVLNNEITYQIVFQPHSLVPTEKYWWRFQKCETRATRNTQDDSGWEMI